MGNLLNTQYLNKSYATYFGHGSANNYTLRLELSPRDNKTKIAARNYFVGLTVFIEKVLHFCFKRRIRWVKVAIQDGSRTTSILLKINSICARTLLSRKDIMSKSPVELSRTLANVAPINWEYKKLGELFPHMTMINLDRRADRLQTFTDHIQTIGEGDLQYKRFSAIDANTLPAADIAKMSKSAYAQRTNKDDRPGRYACYLSHLEVLRDAKARNLPQILVLEDDVRFVSKNLTGPALQKTLKELPQNWGMLFLGHEDLNARKAKDYSDHLVQPGYPVGLHAYVVNASMYDRLIGILEAELNKGHGMRALDVVIAEDVAQHLASEKLLFACKDNVAFQDESYSNILGKVYTPYLKELKEYKSRYQTHVLPKDRTHTADGLPVMPPKLAGTLYQMAHHLTSVFEKHNIRYWADGGTILGMERHKGLIPHDDDIDLWVHPDDTAKLRDPQVSQDLRAVGLEVVDHWVGAKVCAIANHPLGRQMFLSGYRFKTPNIDLFLAKEQIINGERVYGFRNQDAADMWPNYYHKHVDVFDDQGRINQGDFGPIKLNTLQRPREYCHRFYGPNCMSEAYVQYDHINERGLDKRPVQLTDFRLGTYETWEGLPPLPVRA